MALNTGIVLKGKSFKFITLDSTKKLNMTTNYLCSCKFFFCY